MILCAHGSKKSSSSQNWRRLIGAWVSTKDSRRALFSWREDRFIVTFDSGKEYSFPRSSLEVDDGSELVNIQLDRKRFFFRVTQASGNRYEIPWDRAHHEAEPAYPYFRGRTGRTKTPRAIGATIRKLREAKGRTQEKLASAVGMMRNNISRIEGGASIAPPSRPWKESRKHSKCRSQT